MNKLLEQRLVERWPTGKRQIFGTDCRSLSNRMRLRGTFLKNPRTHEWRGRLVFERVLLVFRGHPKVLSCGNENLGVGHGALLGGTSTGSNETLGEF